MTPVGTLTPIRKAAGLERNQGLTYAVIFDWAACVPDLPGCITTGAMEEMQRNIRDAMDGHLGTLRVFGDVIPQPSNVAKPVEVQRLPEQSWNKRQIRSAHKIEETSSAHRTCRSSSRSVRARVKFDRFGPELTASRSPVAA